MNDVPRDPLSPPQDRAARYDLQQRAKAFDYLFDAVVVTDNEGFVTDWNPGSEKLYGYRRDEILGRHVSILHAPEDVARITSEVFTAIERDGRWSGEIKMRHRDGHLGWIESAVIPLLDEDGRMYGALGINRDISERVRDAERLARLAHYDQLTGLPNRYLFFERLQWMIASASRHRACFALIYLDVDDFKAINDAHGHLAGDRVLVTLARRVEQLLRRTDTLARIGGDEFVVLLDNVGDRESLGPVVDKMLEAGARPVDTGLLELSVTLSIGFAFYPGDGTDPDDLLATADKAMYQAKQNGKNTASL